MKISAHDLCRTRLCRATDCGNDAEPYARLCWSCQRRDDAGRRVPMHFIQQPRIPDPSLELCCTGPCGQWKIDDEFSRSSDNGPKRRGRKCACKECERAERAEYRKRLSPEKRAAQAERDRARRLRIRQAQVEHEVQTQAAPEGTP